MKVIYHFHCCDGVLAMAFRNNVFLLIFCEQFWVFWCIKNKFKLYDGCKQVLMYYLFKKKYWLFQSKEHLHAHIIKQKKVFQITVDTIQFAEYKAALEEKNQKFLSTPMGISLDKFCSGKGAPAPQKFAKKGQKKLILGWNSIKFGTWLPELKIGSHGWHC